jgi:hypothetical protein
MNFSKQIRKLKYLLHPFLCILFILILLFCIFKQGINENYQNETTEDNTTPKNKWLILLTTAVNNDEERKKIYLHAINQWLNNTSFDIFVVESSEYTFDEIKNDRLHVHTFKFNEKLASSSQYEAKSILHILNKLKNDDKYKECTHILKVTGRYYLDGIEDVLTNVENDKDLYLQIHRKEDIKWQNSEYLGIRKEWMEELVNTIKEEGIFEHKLYDFSLNKEFIHIGPFKNNVKRGGDGTVISDL